MAQIHPDRSLKEEKTPYINIKIFLKGMPLRKTTIYQLIIYLKYLL